MLINLHEAMEPLVAATVGHALLVRVPVLTKDFLYVVLGETVHFQMNSSTVTADESAVG